MFAAGATGVRARSAVTAAAVGIAIRLTVARQFATSHRAQVEDAVDIIDRWALPIAGLHVVLLLLSAARRRNRSSHSGPDN
jgi:hypothetical protein